MLIRLEIAGSWGRGLISILIRNFTFSAAWPLAVNSVGVLVRVQVPPNQTCWLPKGHGAPLPSRGLPLQPAWSWRITAKQQMRSIPAGRPTRLPPTSSRSSPGGVPAATGSGGGQRGSSEGGAAVGHLVPPPPCPSPSRGASVCDEQRHAGWCQPHHLYGRGSR